MEKLKENRFYIIVTSLLTLMPVVIGLFLYDRLPEQIPSHFGLNGEVNQYSSKNFTVFFIGFFLFAMHLFCLFITLHDPKNRNISNKVLHLILWICPFVAFYLSFIVYGYALGVKFDIAKVSLLFVGIIFLVMGNYLPKCRQNYTIGIKCAWTLNDKENWDRTHRFSSYVFVCAGLLMMGSVFLKTDILPYFVFAVVFVVSFLPFLYSYLFYRKKLKKEES